MRTCDPRTRGKHRASPRSSWRQPACPARSSLEPDPDLRAPACSHESPVPSHPPFSPAGRPAMAAQKPFPSGHSLGSPPPHSSRADGQLLGQSAELLTGKVGAWRASGEQRGKITSWQAFDMRPWGHLQLRWSVGSWRGPVSSSPCTSLLSEGPGEAETCGSNRGCSCHDL